MLKDNQMVGMAGRSGGQRVGAGRRPGSGTVRQTAQMAVKVAQEIGITPVELLLREMKFFNEQSLYLRDELHALIANDAAANVDKIKETKTEMLRYAELARVRAVDASPYVHARLATAVVEIEQKPSAEVQRQIDQLIAILDQRASDKAKLVEAVVTSETRPMKSNGDQ